MRNRIIFELPRLHAERSVVAARDARLLDGQWHTLVVAVSGTSVAMYLDCVKLKSK